MARVKYTLDITEGVDEVWFSRMSRIDCRINNASAPWASSKKEYELTWKKKNLNIARISDFLIFWSFARMKWKSYRPYRLIYCESFTVTIRMHFERMIFWKFRDVSINLGGSAKLRKAIISEIPSRLIYCPLWLNELNNCYACKGWQFKPCGNHWHLANVPFLYPHIRKPEV